MATTNTATLLNATDALSHATGFTYDIVGRRTKSSADALGQSESFTWDARDRLTRHVNAAGETNIWSYDGNGNQTAWTDPQSTPAPTATTRWIGRRQPPCLGDSAAFVTYGYDDANNRVKRDPCVESSNEVRL